MKYRLGIVLLALGVIVLGIGFIAVKREENRLKEEDSKSALWEGWDNDCGSN